LRYTNAFDPCRPAFIQGVGLTAKQPKLAKAESAAYIKLADLIIFPLRDLIDDATIEQMQSCSRAVGERLDRYFDIEQTELPLNTSANAPAMRPFLPRWRRGLNQWTEDIPSLFRFVRNDTAGVLRRVQAGEEVTITVNGQPVAVIGAVQPRRRRWLTKGELVKRLETSRADAGLREDLAELAGESTDDLDEL